MRAKRIVYLIVAAIGCACAPARADLLSYVARPEPEFRWEKKSETPLGELKVTDLYLCSQVWKGIKWEHTVRVMSPPKVEYPNAMVLMITGGNPGPQELMLGSMVANALGARFAVLYNIPNQPLFGGLSEDDLIAHTYMEYMKSGDEEWPLLFPMAKSAVKAMDALQAFSEQEWGQKIDTFVVTGASKRGWTTWLTGIADPRVKGIAPIVYDNLNIPAQMPYQLKTWGKYSEQIDDYTRRGLQQQLNTPLGRKLVRMVDPYSYLPRLKMPKLIINATNDRYWTLDALNLYFSDLPGDNWILYVPNQPHGIQDAARVVAAEAAFFRHVAGGQQMPRMRWTYGRWKGGLTMRLESDPQPKSAKLWIARSATRDFRESKWEASPMQARGAAFVAVVDPPKKGSIAFFAEPQFDIGGKTFTLSTSVRILPEMRPAR